MYVNTAAGSSNKQYSVFTTKWRRKCQKSLWKVAVVCLQKPRVWFVNAHHVEKLSIAMFFCFPFRLLFISWHGSKLCTTRLHGGLRGLRLHSPSLPQTEGRGSDKAQPRDPLAGIIPTFATPLPTLSLPPSPSLDEGVCCLNKSWPRLRDKEGFLCGAGWMLSNGK